MCYYYHIETKYTLKENEMTKQFNNVLVTMKDAFTGEKVERTIDKTNAMNMKVDGFFMGSKEDQAENLKTWIAQRANEQHETFLDLVKWEFVA